MTKTDVSCGARPGRLEEILAAAWRHGLRLPEVGLHDRFVDLGGDSMAAIRILGKLRERAHFEPEFMSKLLEATTVAEQAACLRLHYPALADALAAEEEIGAVPAGDRNEPPEILRTWLSHITEGLEGPPGPRNPKAVFILCCPRSGSTLLRMLLAGHPDVFAPPELHTLAANDMAERARVVGERKGIGLLEVEGLRVAVMNAWRVGASEADRLIEEAERRAEPSWSFLRRMQEAVAPRILVEKTPENCFHAEILARMERWFDAPLYLHLVRAPGPTIRSLGEMLGGAVDTPGWEIQARAEAIWNFSHRNILTFLAGIPAARQMRVAYEDLVVGAEPVMRRVCSFLGLGFVDAVARLDGVDRMIVDPGTGRATAGDVKAGRRREIVSLRAGPTSEEIPDWRLEPETREMASRLGYGLSESGITIPETDRRLPMPLSFNQQRIWKHYGGSRDVAGQRATLVAVFRGRLDAGLLASCVEDVMERHELFRTRYVETPDGVRQVVEALPAGFVALEDLRGGGEPAWEARLARETAAPIALGAGLPFRAAVVRLWEEEMRLLISLHHMVFDAWGVGMLLAECLRFLRRRLAGLQDRPPRPARQYGDYAVWQQREYSPGSARREAEIGYWERELAGLSAGEPTFAISGGRREEGKAARLELALDERAAAGIAEAAAMGSATEFAVILAALADYWGTRTGAPEVAWGTYVSQRMLPELQEMAGFFSNAAMLRIPADGSAPFEERILAAARKLRAAQQFGTTPYDDLLKELRARGVKPPRAGFFVVVQPSFPPAAKLPGIDVEFKILQGGGGIPMVTTLAWKKRTDGGGWEGTLEFNTAMVDGAAATAFWAGLNDHFIRLLFRNSPFRA